MMNSEQENRLWDYIMAGGDELSEAVNSLFRAKEYDYCFSDEFNEALERELENQLDNYEEHFDIVEKEVVIPESKRIIKEIVPKR